MIDGLMMMMFDGWIKVMMMMYDCLLYTSDAADELDGALSMIFKYYVLYV